MTRLHIERAGPADAREMADLLNEIIQIGGTTAYLDPIHRDHLVKKMENAGDRGAFHTARNDQGELLGFQWIEPHPTLPPEVAQIATFVRVGQTGLGIGSKLFDATRTAAQSFGYGWIDATIRADNESGLTYYQSRGFETWKTDPDAVLSDGSVVGKISKRFNLD